MFGKKCQISAQIQVHNQNMSIHSNPSWAAIRPNRRAKRVLLRAAISVVLGVVILVPATMAYLSRIDTIAAGFSERAAVRQTSSPLTISEPRVLHGGRAWRGVRVPERTTP